MSDQNKLYDVLIIGAGAAGLTASIYTCRKQLSTIIVSADVGGQTNLTMHIENYPGYDDETPGYPSGPKLMQIFERQAKKFGAELVYGKVIKVDKTQNGFKIKLANEEEYEAKVLILAYGKVANELGIPGEAKFMGRGVSTCSTCDMPVFKSKTVAIIGGGNSAVEAALDGSEVCKKVYLVHRRDSFRADEISVKKLKEKKNVELILNSVAMEVKGDKFVSGFVVEDLNTKKRWELAVDGVFIEIGYKVDTSAVAHLVKLNEKKEILVDERCATSYPGIFAAGDITQMPFKQTVSSAGEGCKAGLEAHRYLTGGKGVSIDW